MGALTRLGLPGDEKAWTTLGFTVSDGGFRIGGISCTIDVRPSWGFDGAIDDPGLLGIPELLSDDSDESFDGTTHPNVVSFIDHVVYWVPDLDEAVAALTAVLGAGPRRRFRPRGPSGPEMAFFRAGEAVLEVVASGKPATLPGIAFGTRDLDTTVATIRATDGPISDPKPAVQGGRIASVWSGHANWGIAFYEPPARS
ncbi:VOC family protein [Nocardia vaccinii]|uniref:VOC family protein n=1 Tax=Nocardia vaccinii TaxID=1822 RepID=UPI00082A5746|nr:VOC family protein [Nocardia vaccinii]